MTVDDARGDRAALPRDPAALERAIEARRAHLAQTLDELAQRAKPQAVARRSAAGASRRFRRATTTDEGGLRLERIAALVAAVVVVITLVGLGRHRRAR